MKLNLAPQRFLVCQRDRFTLTYYYRRPLSVAFTAKRTYPIAVGAEGYATPRGLYVIHEKARNPEWQVPDSAWARDAGLRPGTIVAGGVPENPIRERWMGVTNTGVGIHGTLASDSIGTRASHGCIRMRPEDVIALYELVPKGCPLYVI